MLRRWKQLFERGQDSGFSIAELTLVMLIVGILSAAAVPLYLGYVTDAKAAEAKVIAGSLWTALQTNAMVFCGTGAAVTGSYPRAGFTSSGETTPSRWAVSSGGTNTLTTDCSSGARTVSASPLFVIQGTSADVDSIQVQLVYSPAVTPPSQLQCSKDSGATFADC